MIIFPPAPLAETLELHVNQLEIHSVPIGGSPVALEAVEHDLSPNLHLPGGGSLQAPGRESRQRKIRVLPGHQRVEKQICLPSRNRGFPGSHM